jgi:hypothetical protein
MADDKSVKKKIRERDQQRCSRCGMTAEQHRLKFTGRGLNVHRVRSRRYEPDNCETLCEDCHRAKHYIRCAVRQRDGFVCTECGMTDAEHRKVYSRRAGLHVHCHGGVTCRESELRRMGVKECITLCRFCHLAKHSIVPAVLRRDGFQCRDCGKAPADQRLFYLTVGVHRLSGDCEEPVGPDGDPGEFVTLCDECHKAKHPDPLGERLKYGWTVDLPKHIREFGDQLGVTPPIVSRDQLGTYKAYLLLVNFFIEHFRKNGVPEKGAIPPSAIDLPGPRLTPLLRAKAAEEAVGELQTPIIGFSEKELVMMSKMTESEKQGHLQARKDWHLDWVVKQNAEPYLTMRKGLLRRSVNA